MGLLSRCGLTPSPSLVAQVMIKDKWLGIQKRENAAKRTGGEPKQKGISWTNRGEIERKLK